MSLYGAMTTAVSGLNAQAKSLGNISDNVANSQTIGFKRVDTSFVNYLTLSNRYAHTPGFVAARPDYTNTLQGLIELVEDRLSISIAGQGFFAVSRADGTQGGLPTFDDQVFYTRAGDFTMDANGYLVNSAGHYLRSWPTDASGNVDRTRMQELRITDTLFNPVATSEVTLGANLPADLAVAGATQTSQLQIYDTLGALRSVQLGWTKNGANEWTLAIDVPDDINAPARGTVDLFFGDAALTGVPDGTIGDLLNATGAVTAAGFGAGAPAAVTFVTDFGNGPQAVTVNLGTFGTSEGLTQFAGTEYAVRTQNQNGVPLGAFSSLAFRDNGDAVINYDNGQTRLVGRVPVITFSDADRLQRQDGQSFTQTQDSGAPRVLDSGGNGAGRIIASSVERSNVDIAAEFTKLIVAQRAYTANTKVVTASDEMLLDTLNMRR